MIACSPMEGVFKSRFKFDTEGVLYFSTLVGLKIHMPAENRDDN